MFQIVSFHISNKFGTFYDTQKKYIYDDVDRQWKGHNLDGDATLSWDEYNATTYSNLPGEGAVYTHSALLA